MITKRFDYAALSRASEGGKRYYCAPGNQKLPSVTTILSATKSEQSRQALANWKRRVGAAKAQQITTEAANRGTRMHAYLEHYIETGEMKPVGTNPYSWPGHAMAQTIIDQGLTKCNEYWGTEVSLYYPKLYAGTTDLVGVHLDKHAIMDFKQTNKPKKDEWIEDYKLQLAAYALAHNEVYGTKIKKGVIIMCVKPEVDDNGNLTSEPQYQEFVVEGAEFDYWEQQWWKRLESYYVGVFGDNEVLQHS